MGKLQSKPWRECDLNSDSEEWNKKTVETLLLKIEEFGGTLEEPKKRPNLKIIVIGDLGAGKSSLINSFFAALTGNISNITVEGCFDHVTGKFLEFPAISRQYKMLDFAFFDVKGKGHKDKGSALDDLLRAILGKKKVGDKFLSENEYNGSKNEDAEEKIQHVVLFTMDCSAYENHKGIKTTEELFETMFYLRGELYENNVTSYLILTHMDKIVTALKKNIKLMHTNTKVGQLVEEVQEKTGLSIRNIFPVVNPVWEIHEMSIPYRIYFLYILWPIVRDARYAYIQRSFESRE